MDLGDEAMYKDGSLDRDSKLPRKKDALTPAKYMCPTLHSRLQDSVRENY